MKFGVKLTEVTCAQKNKQRQLKTLFDFYSILKTIFLAFEYRQYNRLSNTF